ncbi:MAG: glutaredoxin domain-containing protein, partial [Halobacteria archaeon]|nr:glutaredoxin domain-containing protein [Halobacteria archaeon]
EKNNVIVFMKGNKLMPQCGYSARAVETVAEYTEEFETVDVLKDERIREVLEEVTDWPTIPQVFVDGEFLGGSDTLVEMHEEGDLAEKMETVS